MRRRSSRLCGVRDDALEHAAGKLAADHGGHSKHVTRRRDRAARDVRAAHPGRCRECRSSQWAAPARLRPRAAPAGRAPRSDRRTSSTKNGLPSVLSSRSCCNSVERRVAPRSEQPIAAALRCARLWTSVSCVPKAPCAERQRVSAAVRRAQQDPFGRQALGHHREEFARRLIHPVQVFEHDDERAAPGRRHGEIGRSPRRCPRGEASGRAARASESPASIDSSDRRNGTEGRKASPNGAVVRSIRSPITSSESPGLERRTRA